MKKLTTTILLLFVCFGCRSQYERVAKVYNGETTISVSIDDRDIGYDSIQLLVNDSGKIEANFCYPNGLRFKKDTVYTKDTAYREWGRVWQIAPDVVLATRHGATILIGKGFYDIRKLYWDSIVVNGYQIKVKPQSK